MNALLSQAVTTETNDGLANQFQVGLFPFIQNLCTASANSSNSCSVGLTNSLTGGTITTFASQLANLLDTGQNATLGSGGTHFENALKGMNTFITNAAIGTGTGPNNALPYVFIVTDGSQDYQTQSGGNWSVPALDQQRHRALSKFVDYNSPEHRRYQQLLCDDEGPRDNGGRSLHSLRDDRESKSGLCQ